MKQPQSFRKFAMRMAGCWTGGGLCWLLALSRTQRMGPASPWVLALALAGLVLLAAGAWQARNLPGIDAKAAAWGVATFAFVYAFLLFDLSLAPVSLEPAEASGIDAFVERISLRRSTAQTKTALWAAGVLLAGSLAAMPLYRRCRRYAAQRKGYDPSVPRDAALGGLLLFFLWAGVIWPLAWAPAVVLSLLLTALRAKPLGLGWAALISLLQPWGMLDELIRGQVFMPYRLAPGRPGGEAPILDQQAIRRQIEADMLWNQVELDRNRRQRRTKR